MKNEDIVICRCSDVTLADLYELFEQGYDNFEELKRIARVGMGPCQGNTCAKMIQWEIAKYFDRPLEACAIKNIRPFTMGVKLQAIKEAAEDED